jgi:hypothetical protein
MSGARILLSCDGADIAPPSSDLAGRHAWAAEKRRPMPTACDAVAGAARALLADRDGMAA